MTVASAHAALAKFMMKVGDAAGAQEHALVALANHTRLADAQPTNRGWQHAILSDYELLLATAVSARSPQKLDWEQKAGEVRTQFAP